MGQNLLKSSLLAIALIVLSGCAMFAAYNSLSPEEKTYYQSVADQMTTTQKMHFLELKDPQERQAYLKGLNLQEVTVSSHGHASEAHASVEKVSSPVKSKKVAEENIAPEIAPVKPVKSAPDVVVPTVSTKQTVQAAEPSVPTSNVARVKYAKTGDPITDVLILLDLYEKGKISKMQFEHEKELALQKTP